VTVESAIDTHAIHRLYVEYVRSIDDGDLERWPEMFIDECSYQILARENVRRGLPLATMRCDSRDMLRDRVQAIQSSAFYVSRTVRHVVGLLDIHAGIDAFGVRANFAVFESFPRAATTLLCAGVYDDIVVHDGDGLRFRQKHCIYDGDLVTDSIVYPL
jgi:salicylate 5-hydroxylase small subunit